VVVPNRKVGLGPEPEERWPSRVLETGTASRSNCRAGEVRAMTTLLLILLVLVLVGALPTWPYSSGWGYYPSGGLGLVLIILLILYLTGRI
jgi:hypothetical protein